jgi:hypothetical protein
MFRGLQFAITYISNTRHIYDSQVASPKIVAVLE